jgi:hypothetical protein
LEPVLFILSLLNFFSLEININFKDLNGIEISTRFYANFLNKAVGTFYNIKGRAYLPEQIKPALLAKILCKFTDRKGSLTSPYGMQCAINEVGWFRILVAAIIGGIGKLLGRKGWFFIIAGRQVALIDDFAGTMPPYHRHVVLGPKDPDKVCDMIKEKTGVDAVIIDANDLHKADCVGASKGVDKKYVEKLFLDNPSGNSEQQTPIVVIKNYKSHIPTSA